MVVPLSPKSAVMLADSAYGLQFSSNMAAAVPLAGAASDEFDILKGTRFTGVTGVGASSGFGYVAAGKSVRQKEMLVAVRGTVTVNDWLTDAYMAGTRGPTGLPVHKGFAKSAESILPAVEAALRGKQSIDAIHLVGHSLGGAIATLLADSLAARAPVKLYTFGAPRAGTIPHTQVLTGKIGAGNVYRVYHDTDPVPMVPIFPFSHLPAGGGGYLVPGSGAIISFASHKMANYQKSVGDAGWSGLPTISHSRFSFETVDDVLEQAGAISLGPSMFNVQLLRLINQGIELLMDQIARSFGSALFVGATVLDRMASILASGAAAALAVAEQVREVLEMILKFLGRAIATGVKITVYFIRWILEMLFSTIAGLARQAIAFI